MSEYALLHDIITSILLDVGLQDASGYDCARQMLALNPEANIIFISGQCEMIPSDLAGLAVFLQKPFTIDQLEKAVHDVQIHHTSG